MSHQYKPKGVCSRNIAFDLVDGAVHNVVFEGGCSGNCQGIARLIEGMSAQEAVKRLAGIRYGFKSTSCPDQLAAALQKALSEDGSQR